MAQHTPGPWRYVPHENGVEFDIVSGAEKPWPWYLATTHDMEGASEANARLIAAAPDMFETLKTAQQMLQGQDCAYLRNLIDGTLAKVEGRS